MFRDVVNRGTIPHLHFRQAHHVVWDMVRLVVVGAPNLTVWMLNVETALCHRGVETAFTLRFYGPSFFEVLGATRLPPSGVTLTICFR